MSHIGRYPRDMIVLIATTSSSHVNDLRRMLGPGVEVRWAESCQEALRLLCVEPISVVLCDADLPDGGWRLTLRQAQGKPVVVFSQFADESLWSEVLHFGAYDLLLLPFDAGEVRRVTAAAARSAIMIHV